MGIYYINGYILLTFTITFFLNTNISFVSHIKNYRIFDKIS